MAHKYAFKDYNKDTMARGVVLATSVSTKHCVEICNAIRGKKVARAKIILDDAMEMKKAIPFRRFKLGIGHKTGIGPGRYPIKACGEVLKTIKSCEANAQNKGLNPEELKIVHISANLASRPWHYGRARRRKMKRTNVEIVLKEMEKKHEPKKNNVAKD